MNKPNVIKPPFLWVGILKFTNIIHYGYWLYLPSLVSWSLVGWWLKKHPEKSTLVSWGSYTVFLTQKKGLTNNEITRQSYDLSYIQ